MPLILCHDQNHSWFGSIMLVKVKRVGLVANNLLQSLQIAPTIAGLEAACASSPIETNAYANTIVATNSFIMKRSSPGIFLKELRDIDLEVTT